MNILAKITIGTALAFLVGCSGKGDTGSRINNVPADDETLQPTDPEEDPSTPAGPSEKKNIAGACMQTDDVMCVEMSKTYSEMLEDCTPANKGKTLDECPTGGKKCSFTELGMPSDFTFYAYGISCDKVLSDYLMVDDEDNEYNYDYEYDY